MREVLGEEVTVPPPPPEKKQKTQLQEHRNKRRFGRNVSKFETFDIRNIVLMDWLAG